MKNNRRSDYSGFKRKLYLRLVFIGVAAPVLIYLFYLRFWYRRGGDVMVSVFRALFRISDEEAHRLYTIIFRGNIAFFWIAAILILFFLLLRMILNWFTNYFDAINRGIDGLLSDDGDISLPPEMSATERKLNEVRSELHKRAVDAQLAEQRKNDLVMYLAHDIRTPLTSVIGYLSLLSEAPDMPAEQRARYVGITLDKAYRLEKMINEFFEITRYNLNEITLAKEKIDLCYMLVQLTDEFSPLLMEHGNTAVLDADEDLTVCGDPDRLARVFQNILKNAAAYSDPGTEIRITAWESDDSVVIVFRNHGRTIPREKLSSLFEKFYRLDEARASVTGGAGLGLAIAKEIVTLHGGTIAAESSNGIVEFTVTLPKQPAP